MLRFWWQRDLPAPVRADVDVITSVERLPRFTDSEREVVRDGLLELLLLLQKEEPGHAGPSQWRKAIEDKFRQTLRELHPLDADRLLAIALRGHTWQTQGESSWDLFSAGGKVLQGFEQASAGVGRLAVAMYSGLRDWLRGRGSTDAAAPDGAQPKAEEAAEDHKLPAEGQCPSEKAHMAPPETVPTDTKEDAHMAPPENVRSDEEESDISWEDTDHGFEGDSLWEMQDVSKDDVVSSEEDATTAGDQSCRRSSAGDSTCEDEWPETFPCSFAPPPVEATAAAGPGIASRVAEASASGATAYADAWAAGSHADVATAQATGASASATAHAVGAQANVANAAVTGVAASASASATGAEANVANVSVTGASASATVSAVGAQANVGNVSITGAAASASLNVQGASANVGNVSVQGAGAHAFADVGLGVDVGNVSVSSPASFSVGVRVGKLSFGNVSVGGFSLVLDLNPLNWFTNLALGGGGGGKGGKGGGDGEGGGEGGEGRAARGGSGGGGVGGGGEGAGQQSAGAPGGQLAAEGGAGGHHGAGPGAGQAGGGGQQGDQHGGAPHPQPQPAPGQGGGELAPGGGEGRAGRLARLLGELQERLPNIHYDHDGSRYRNGVLDKMGGGVREAPAMDKTVPEGAPVEPTAQGDEHRRRDAQEGRPNPLGAGLDVEGEHRRVLANVGAPDGDPSSCARFAQAAYSHTDPESRTQLHNIGAKEVPQMLDRYLREPNSMAVVSVKFAGPDGGQGDHHFVVTGHADQVQVSHAWQGEHGPRNEKPMPREQFVRDWRTLQTRGATQQERRAAFRRIFPAAPGSAGDWKMGVDAVAVGRTRQPMVNAGGHDGAKGLRPARRELPPRPIPLQPHQRRAKRRRCEDAADGATPAAGGAPDRRSTAVPQRHTNRRRGEPGDVATPAAASANGHSAAVVPGAPSGSSAPGSRRGGRGLPLPVDPETLALLRELARADGLPISDGDLQAFLAAGGVSAAREQAKRMEEEEERTPKELCDFCKQRGKPCCMKCLLSSGSRKVVKLRGSIHGFAT